MTGKVKSFTLPKLERLPVTYREWLQREIASAECAAGRGSEDDEIRAEALKQSLAALDRENEALGDTDPCGHPVIALPRDRRIALAAERFVKTEWAVIDARAELLKVRMRDETPDADAVNRLHWVRLQRNEAFHALASEIENA